jgi:hypothetical protein
LLLAQSATLDATVTITANTSASHAISPWIYGTNFYEQWPNGQLNLPLNRTGGNRWTAYNWENNASNAGSDWQYSSDSYLSSSTVPAEAVRSVVAADRARGNASLITVQMQGYVSADENGSVSLTDSTRLTTRFKQVVYQKGSAFTTAPSTVDRYVYMDEFVWALKEKIGSDIYKDKSIPTMISLDNEPDIWFATHAEVQMTVLPSADFDTKSIALSKALKDLEPDAVIFGPVNYGFNGMYTFQGQKGFSVDYWFVDQYLKDLRSASEAYGRRLVDVYDFHWYSSNQVDGTTITSLKGANLTDAQMQGIVQSPRSYWDTTYTENSWIAQVLGGPVRIVSRMQDKIAADWPGTALAITEYNNGGEGNIAGAVAQADSLGVFGQMGLYAACYWPLGSDTTYINGAFMAYRNYDGNRSTFGDTSVPTTSSDTSKVAAYISLDSNNAARCVIVAINRSNESQTVAFSGFNFSGSARYFRISTGQNTPVAAGSGVLNLATDTVDLPAYTVTTIEITGTLTYDIPWARANQSSSAGWYKSPWYGWFCQTPDMQGWIYSPKQDWQYVWGGSTDSSVYIYDMGTASWWWTCASFWPNFYDYTDGGWYLYYGDGASPKRWFYNSTKGVYVKESDMPHCN